MIENKENKKELALSYMKKILKREKKLFIFLFVIFLFIIFIPKIADQYLLKIPKPGGNVAEIHIGSPPRFINPVLASSSSDRDLLPFIYSSLLKRDINGKITPSVGYIALSENKKVYTVTLDEDVIFSDGKNLTAEDVIFTINKIQDPLIRSPYAVQ
jgi:ABC-type transport system substrate-binding protein